jgi:rhamnose transport system ATP-binding protein
VPVETSETSQASAYITLEDASRSFGATRAVRSVSMDLASRGQVHALVGENGAGKSTCLGLAAGRFPPSSGAVIVDGERLHPHTAGGPREARRRGVRAIYQELMIVPALSPAANVFLGQDLSTAGWLRNREMRSEYEQLCARIGVTPVTATRCDGLSIADQQLLEVLRAIASNAVAILFDEPTAALAHAERAALFRTMAGLTRDNVAIALVSHNLEEVLDHSDLVTVLRDGAVVEARPTTEWTKRELVSSMLGGSRGIEVAAGVQWRAHVAKQKDAPVAPAQAPILEVDALNSAGHVRNISFRLYPGEILGIAGLVGSGRTSLLRALAGLDRHAHGVVRTTDGSADVPSSVSEARRRGIALLPESRKTQGLVLTRSAASNIVLGEWKSLSHWGFASDRSVMRAATTPAEQVGFSTARLGSDAGELSGGNQQKLMLARWLHTEHNILLADEPTRGVDVGAKGDILLALEKIVASGRSVIVVSSELEEVVGLSDRVLVLNAGALISTLDASVDEINPEILLQMMFNVAESEDHRVTGAAG